MRKALAAYTAFLLVALYAPVAVMTMFSFNASKLQVHWTGFTLDWYRKLIGNRDLLSALENTVVLALGSAACACVLGTLAALAVRRAFPGRRAFVGLVSVPLMIPDIVLAFAFLALIRAAATPSLGMAMLAHATFCLSYVAVVVSARLQTLDPALELAAQDLGATPWRAFWSVTFPQIRPAVHSGALLAVTLSVDDFVVTYFTAGPDGATLPVKIFSMIRFQVTPEINAVSTLILVASAAMIAAALRLGRPPLEERAR